MNESLARKIPVGECSPLVKSIFVDEIAAALLIEETCGTIQYANERACRGLGRRPYELLGRHYSELFWPEFIQNFECLLAQCADGDEHTGICYCGERAAWEQLAARRIDWEGAAGIFLTITNISEVMVTQYMSDNMMYFDNLLKLPNGTKLEEDINDLASVEAVALIYFAIEGLGVINNLYGWHNGDYLLMQIRDWLLFSEPRRAQLYRLEDGFAILGRLVDKEDSRERAEAILRRFEQPWALPAGGRSMSVFCSIKLGVVHGKYIRNEMRNLLIRTIEATQKGKRYTIYDEEVDRKSREMLKIRDSLINCVYNGMKGFELHYQPIVDMQTGQWRAVEALCRWTMPDGARVPPDMFIRVSEQLGLIGELDAWVQKRAMQQCVALGLSKKRFMLSVNFSPMQKIDAEYIARMRRALLQTGFPATKLTLEVTENVRMPFDEESLQGLGMIAEQGVCLSLDDFGTGYSSLENLIKISASVLKVDKMFLDDIEQDQNKQYLLQMLVELGKRLGMRVVAEGVETPAQHELLKNYGVDYAQGYLFSKPLPYQQLAGNVHRFG